MSLDRYWQAQVRCEMGHLHFATWMGHFAPEAVKCEECGTWALPREWVRAGEPIPRWEAA